MAFQLRRIHEQPEGPSCLRVKSQLTQFLLKADGASMGPESSSPGGAAPLPFRLCSFSWLAPAGKGGEAVPALARVVTL